MRRRRYQVFWHTRCTYSKSCAVFSAWNILWRSSVCSSIYFVEGLMVPITACGKPGVAVKIMNRTVHFCLQSHFMAFFRISIKSPGFIGSRYHISLEDSFSQDVSSFLDGEVRFVDDVEHLLYEMRRNSGRKSTNVQSLHACTFHLRSVQSYTEDNTGVA